MNSPITQKFIGIYILIIFLATGCSGINQLTMVPTTSPTASSAIPTVTPSSITAPTTIVPTLTATVAKTSQVSADDKASFVSETYPDNSVVTAGEKFTKTWVIKNTGNLTWTTAYRLVLYAAPQGDTLGSPFQFDFSQETAPGETVSLSVPLVAPATGGTYTVYWSIRNEQGETVAVDGGNLWAKVQVCEAGQACSAPAAAGGTSITVNGVTVTVTDFTYDAQSATVDFCMTVDFHHYSLMPAPSLLVDGSPAPFLTGGSDFSSGAECMQMTYQVGAAGVEQAQHIVLSIDGSLRMSPPPGDPDTACQAARLNLVAQHPGLDFQCHFSMAGYYTNLQLPADLTREQANQLITDTIEGAIYGPWTLTIK
jgi:Ig-like domain from next to BRCA1 gene